MKGELTAIKANLRRLLLSRMWRFPSRGERLTAPDQHGVYIIYDPKGRVSHVGRTIRGKRGLYQRLNNHLHGRSSFVIKALNGRGARLRGEFKFRYIRIENSRLRALVEAFAIGQLCPDHLGCGDKSHRCD